MKIIAIILVFGIIVFIHELGHFIFAKLNHITVTEFAIGMGPAIVKFGKGETTYSIRILPIGGYCMMVGEDSESEDENAFSNKSLPARMSVVLAGPFFNFILAFIFAIILCHFCGIDPAKVEMVENGAAVEAGMQNGDQIIGIENQTIINYREVLIYMNMFATSDPIEVRYLRDGKEYKTTITPKKQGDGSYKIGVVGGYEESDGFLEDIKYGAFEVRYWIKSTVLSLKMLVTGGASKDDLMGPVGVGNMMSDVIDEAEKQGGMADVLLNILNFCILLSANLGVMNLLPIPALDGGRLLFLIVEGITRRKIPKNKEALVNAIGFVLLMLLMVFVFINDIRNVFFK